MTIFSLGVSARRRRYDRRDAEDTAAASLECGPLGPLWRVLGAALLLTATASAQRFKPVEDHGVWWLQSAAGKPMFSFGVCVVDTGPKWEEYDLKNPSYSAFRFYPTKPQWAADAVRVLESGGFNTVGAWSEYRSLLDVPGNNLAFTPINHMGSSAGFPWLDMWDPALVKVADDIARDQVAALKKDPRIIGYFSDNELGWWKGALFDFVWKQKTHGTRIRMVDLLEKRYGTWSQFEKDFQVDDAKSFKQLHNQGHVYLRPGGNGIDAVTSGLTMLAERYYSLCRSLIKKWDPDALYLGDRYISNYYPEVAAQAGKYCDVVSTNLNPNWNDGGYVHYHLDGLRDLTGKPLMVTEYYMCAEENRSGNGNNHSGFPVVKTLAQRASGFRNTTLDFLHEPELLGAHWFQYYDEPQSGRGDGENYNFGLVDINNQPYTELIETAKAIDLSAEHAKAMPFVPSQEGIPPTPADFKDMTLWPRDRAFVPADQKVALGDLYASWSPESLTLGVFWGEERFTDAYFKGGKIPDSSRSTVEIEIPATHTHWTFRLTDVDGKIVSGAPWTFVATPSTGASVLVRIPAAALGKPNLGAGDPVDVRVRLVSRTRAYTTRWKLQRSLTADSKL